MKDTNNYDSIAGIYDRLGRMIYGNALFDSQMHFLKDLPTFGNVLIIGGGTGKIIKPIMETLKPTELVYVEKSASMISISKQNTPDEYKSQVVFLHGTQDDIPKENEFDIIITNFFFDQFEFRTLARIFLVLNTHLKNGGYWLWTDFVPPQKFYHKLLLRLMLLFFSVTTALATKNIYSIYALFERRALRLMSKEVYYGGFIETAVFRK